MTVSWQPLSLSEARGFVLFYTIAYTPLLLNSRKRQANTTYRNASADASSVSITYLDKDLQYRVVMSASTKAGTGILSEAVIAELYTGTGVTRDLKINIIMLCSI